jgi:hypothetical protein
MLDAYPKLSAATDPLLAGFGTDRHVPKSEETWCDDLRAAFYKYL